jgi:hypothetical protein
MILNRNMWLKVIKVINLFWSLWGFFDGQQVHNMEGMSSLDPHFKSFCVVENLVICENAIWLAFEYDVKVVILF